MKHLDVCLAHHECCHYLVMSYGREAILKQRTGQRDMGIEACSLQVVVHVGQVTRFPLHRGGVSEMDPHPEPLAWNVVVRPRTQACPLS